MDLYRSRNKIALGLLQTKSQAELVPFLCHDTRISERFWIVFWTFSCVTFPGISCFLNEWNSRNTGYLVHVIILLVEFLVICTSKTRETHITIEHGTRNLHYSRESPMSISCIGLQLVLFPRNTNLSVLCHSCAVIYFAQTHSCYI